MDEQIAKGVDLRAAIELHSGPVDHVVAVRVEAGPIVIAQTVAHAIADPVVVSPQDEISTPLVHRGRDQDAACRVVGVRHNVVAAIPAV